MYGNHFFLTNFDRNGLKSEKILSRSTQYEIHGFDVDIAVKNLHVRTVIVKLSPKGC